jgi:hypothetical protein
MVFPSCKAALCLDQEKRLLSGRSDWPLADLPSDQPSCQKESEVLPRPTSRKGKLDGGIFLKLNQAFF